MRLVDMMNHVGLGLVKEISNVRFAYVQSDEINIFVQPNEPGKPFWFGNKIQKIVSIGSSIAAALATRYQFEHKFITEEHITFDCRVVVLPSDETEINDYFLWRQRDCIRNSVTSYGRKFFSPKTLMIKGNTEVKRMIKAQGEDWDNLDTQLRLGRMLCYKAYKTNIDTPNSGSVSVWRGKWAVDNEIPNFETSPTYISSLLSAFQESKALKLSHKGHQTKLHQR
eukprot:TRINITY_DN1682_c0_g2_i1.p1 TRINITY_DN1682_c0_g2~~TRINITY_DN1682_c0_g2_i1.p1  ORF type:complete len:225 (+),score=33.57 TRINITY_DN1682_c0_g2_i1:432-1106(+)